MSKKYEKLKYNIFRVQKLFKHLFQFQRNNSAREPLMSIVPEEGSIISNGTNVNNEINGKLEESSSPTGKLKLRNDKTFLLL